MARGIIIYVPLDSRFLHIGTVVWLTPENHGVSSKSLGDEETCLCLIYVTFVLPQREHLIGTCVIQLGTVCTLLGKINTNPKKQLLPWYQPLVYLCGQITLIIANKK